MRNYTVISIIRAQGCRGNNKSADYSSVDLGLKGEEGKNERKRDKRKRDGA